MRSFGNTYAWNHPYHKNGKKTNWFAVLSFLYTGSATKREIIKEVWNRDYDSFNISYTHYANVSETYVITHNSMRGYHSHMFNCMVEDGLIYFDRARKLWYITEYGKSIVELAA